MKIGVVFPQTEIGANPANVRDYAQAAEGLGYDYLLAYDHVLGANPERPGGWRGPYTHREMFHEILVLFGYLAGLTQRIELVTGILILPQRQTALVAKQAAEVAVLSGGRLRLGVGIGWNEVEYIALGEDFHTRGKRIAEQVELLRALWANPLVNFSGENHTIPDAGLNPLPDAPIPIWFGGGADAALQRMARLGDGWIANYMPLEKLRVEIEKVRGYVVEAGRDPATFGIDTRIHITRTAQDGWAKEATQLAAMGVTHAAVNTMGAGFTTLNQHLEVLAQFKAEVQA
ncbi:MAG: LLM class F420-dependent oxidoreductase [Anaerolineae bacterium]|nr:LLM class F420-dependent oxidoreductase [Anaerolineae bacterium]